MLLYSIYLSVYVFDYTALLIDCIIDMYNGHAMYICHM